MPRRENPPRRVANGMGGQKPDISIIIRSKNEERFIARTLAEIFQQQIDLPIEVIVIDSGSTDRTLDIVRTHPVRLYQIESSAFTYGSALNLGASVAQGRYLINLSAHCIPTNNRWIASIVSDLRADAEIAATYGEQIPIQGLNPFEERVVAAAFALDKNGAVGPPFSNANCAVRKEIWQRYPFDEKATFAEDFIWSQILPKQYKI
jgi:glycosyltransferase involved in cell wall biosynthesis